MVQMLQYPLKLEEFETIIMVCICRVQATVNYFFNSWEEWIELGLFYCSILFSEQNLKAILKEEDGKSLQHTGRNESSQWFN